MHYNIRISVPFCLDFDMCLYDHLRTMKVNKWDVQHIKRWLKVCIWGNTSATAKYMLLCITEWCRKWMSHQRHASGLYHSWGYVIVNYKALAVMLQRLNRPYPILWLKVALVSCSATWWISQMCFKSHNCQLNWNKETAVFRD